MKTTIAQCMLSFSKRLTALGISANLLFAQSVWAQEPIVYPAQGQSPAKTATDKAECQAWATRESGFDPLRAAAQAPSTTSTQSRHGGLLRGGAKGAAAGAAIGAIAGNAGKGAAIGATAGGMAGTLRKRHQQQAAEQAQAQQAQVQAGTKNTYLRAYGACLKGRGYSVE